MEDKELKSRLFDLERKINHLEWDDKKNQINPYKKAQLERLKKEKVDLKKEIEDASA